jgi:transcription elongation factor SPT6
MDPRDFVDTEAALDEEDELSANGEDEDARPRKAMNGDIDDSSEEEDDDDDEEAARVESALSFTGVDYWYRH